MIEALTNTEAWQFLLQHEQDDPAKLVLQSQKYPHLPIKQIASQIASRQKAKSKLPHWYLAEKVIFPTGTPLEQCSSEATANYKSELISGSTLVDLTGGTGVDTFFLAKNFEKVFYIEQQAELAALASHNFECLGAKHIEVRNQNAEDFLRHPALSTFDYIYIDPARRDEHNRKLHSLRDCSPDLIQILSQLKNLAKGILIKTSPLLDIHKALEELGPVEAVHVVSLNNECKEVLYLIRSAQAVSSAPKIHCVNIKSSGPREDFIFDPISEGNIDVSLSLPHQYLYEPNASIMKAGAFKSIAERFGLQKLHANSHLYTSAGLVERFPGRSFKLLHILKADKKVLQQHLPEMKAQITTRNYPQSVEELRKKTGLKEGGNFYILATTLMDGRPVLMMSEKA